MRDEEQVYFVMILVVYAVMQVSILRYGVPSFDWVPNLGTAQANSTQHEQPQYSLGQDPLYLPE